MLTWPHLTNPFSLKCYNGHAQISIKGRVPYQNGMSTLSALNQYF